MADNELLPEAVLPDVYKNKVAAPTKRYHVGLVKDGPAWSQTFAGICFPVYSSSFDKADNEFRKEGAIVSLTQDQVKKIKEAIRNRVVRWNHYPEDYRDHKLAGLRCSAQIFDVRTNGFEPEKGDEPLVKYVYFKEAPPEFVEPSAPVAAFEEMDKAIAAAEKSEAVVQNDPVDAATRKLHGELKRAGAKLGDLSGQL